jgi:predicted kinase
MASLFDARNEEPATPGGLSGELRMPTAHLVHGYLGAGKTTFARQLEADLPAIRFTHDEWMSRLYGTDPPLEHFATYHRNVWSLMQDTWVRCLALGLDVVLDMNFWRRSDRDAARSAVAGLGATCKLYDLKCSESETWRRIDARNNKFGRRALDQAQHI